MKLKIYLLATWEPNYIHEVKKKRARGFSFPTLINLAALTPDEDVTVHYEHIKPIDDNTYNIDADIVGISFISPFANHTFEIAKRFKDNGKTVILGGPYVTVFPERCKEHADAIVVGEAEYSWPALIEDFKKGKEFLKKEKIYNEKDYRPKGASCELKLPVPRFDLIKNDVVFSQNIIATRGCPHSCDFCFMKQYTKGFRTRPIDDVIRDIKSHKGKNWLQNKVLGFWDDNLIGNVEYAKELFRRLKPLKKWWVAQVTIKFAYDDELLKLAADSGCVAVYIGFETFNQESLNDVHKPQNRVAQYRDVVKKIHKHGIAVASGLIVGFDYDTKDVFDNSIKAINAIGIDWVNANILVPFEPTKIYNDLKAEGRILTDDSYMYNGTGVSFEPKLMTVQELNDGFLKMVDEIFSAKNTWIRMKTFFKDVPISKLGAWFVFFLSNFVYLFLERMERVLDENGVPVEATDHIAKQKTRVKPYWKKLRLSSERNFYIIFLKKPWQFCKFLSLKLRNIRAHS